MKSVFRGEQAKAVLTQWHEKFRARLKVPTESRTVTTRFGPAHVLVGGPEDGPKVVILHGALASSAHVLHELAPLMDRFRVHAVDVVGQSVKSADARPSVTNNDYGEWLAQVMDGLGLAKARIVAVSWGGFVAIRLAAIAPERIEKLALLVPAGVVTGPAWAGMTKIALPMMLFRMSPTERRLRAFVQNLLSNYDDDWMPYLGDAFRSFNLDMRVPSLAKPEELTRFQAPTLVLGADQDLSFPGEKLLERAPKLFSNLVSAELIKDCRHCPPTTDAFRSWLGDRLTKFLLSEDAAKKQGAAA